MTKDKSTFSLTGGSVYRGGRVLLENLSFTLASGQLMILRGHNGCGKSSLMRSIAGYLPLQAGKFCWNDEDVTNDREMLFDHLSYLGHQNGLKPMLSLRQNMDIIHAIAKGHTLSEDTLLKAADQLTLTDLLDEPVKYFSSGQTRRAALIQLPILDKTLWLMDEPTVGLDRENREKLTAMMRNHLQNGGMIIAATHEELGLDADHVIDLSDYAPNFDMENGSVSDAEIDKALEGWE